MVFNKLINISVEIKIYFAIDSDWLDPEGLKHNGGTNITPHLIQ